MSKYICLDFGEVFVPKGENFGGSDINCPFE
jgi:hypothetical protein